MSGQRPADLGGDAAVLSPRALLERAGELVRDDCGNLRHGAAYRRSSLGNG